MRKRKRYKVKIDENDKSQGLSVVSIVGSPAIEKNFQMFDKQKGNFKLESEDKQLIFGPSLIPDKDIFRIDPKTGISFDLYFEKLEIEKLVDKFAKDDNLNKVSINHNGGHVDASLHEMFFIDRTRNILPKGYEDLPDGTWMTSYKIHDKVLWNKIKKSNDFNGFSVEVTSFIVPFDLEKTPLEKLEDLIEKNKNNKYSMDEFLELCGTKNITPNEVLNILQNK